MLALSLASFAAVASLVVPARAHMEMTYPPPFRSKANPHTTQIEYSMTSPLMADGSDYPCKGFLSDYNTPAGASVAEWNAGGNYHFTLQGGAAHNGGSCQALLSYDQGKTFTVIKSLIGACPVAITPTDYDVTVPADAPSGDAIFAWTWFNNLGNREMYMNCAHIVIKGGGNSKRDGTAFSERPSNFIANVNNGCSTLEGSDLDFPNPGPDVINKSGKTSPPLGNCQAGPGSGGNNAGSQSSAAAAPSSEAAAPSSAASSAAAAPSSSASFDDGQWHPETSAAVTASSSANDGQWQPEPTSSSTGNGEGQSTSSATVNPPVESGKNRKKKCVRRQKRSDHHRRRSGPHGGRSRNF